MNQAQFEQLASLADTAEESIESLRFGSHYALKLLLQKYGIIVRSDDRMDLVRAARRLCNEWIYANSQK